MDATDTAARPAARAALRVILLAGLPAHSELPSIADVSEPRRNFRVVPLATEVHCGKATLFDHLVGLREKHRRNLKAKRFGRLSI